MREVLIWRCQPLSGRPRKIDAPSQIAARSVITANAAPKILSNLLVRWASLRRNFNSMPKYSPIAIRANAALNVIKSDKIAREFVALVRWIICELIQAPKNKPAKNPNVEQN